MTTAGSEPVASVLLPALLHEVNNATQLLVGLRAILELPGGDAMFQGRVDDLGRTSATMDDLGFALAVVATAGGANMLLARRDDRSVRILWDLSVKAVTRHGGVKVFCDGDAPLTRPAAMDGWQPAWAAAALVIAASGENGERVEDWRWAWERLEDGSAQLVGTASDSVGTVEDAVGRDTLALVGERIAPLGTLTAKGQEICLWMPGDWFLEP